MKLKPIVVRCAETIPNPKHEKGRMKTESQVKIAKRIAMQAHAGQFRRDGLTPYIVHPRAVAMRLKNESETIVSAAWLHDVLEDTKLHFYDLMKMGIRPEVLDIVWELTKQDGISYEDFIKKVSRNKDATKIKMADIICNLSDNPTNDQIVKYAKALLQLAPIRNITL